MTTRVLLHKYLMSGNTSRESGYDLGKFAAVDSKTENLIVLSRNLLLSLDKYEKRASTCLEGFVEVPHEDESAT